MHPVSSLTLSITIRCCPHKVYDFLVDPRNLPRWASGLAAGIRREGEGSGWLADGPAAQVSLHFAPVNDFGVLDHVVTLPDGHSVMVPMRVLDNHGASELLFTLFRQPGMDDDRFRADADWVRRDLQALKALLELPA